MNATLNIEHAIEKHAAFGAIVNTQLALQVDRGRTMTDNILIELGRQRKELLVKWLIEFDKDENSAETERLHAERINVMREIEKTQATSASGLKVQLDMMVCEFCGADSYPVEIERIAFENILATVTELAFNEKAKQ